MTLGLFGLDAPFERLLDDSPLISGQHASHLYLGTLGAQALAATGSSNCYDPALAGPAARAADRAAYADPRLTAVVDAWAELPEEMKAAIVAMVDDAGGGVQQER